MKNCALFCGGYSSEFDISMKSADNILKSFPKEFEVFKVIVSSKSWKVQYHKKSFDFNFTQPGFEVNSKRVQFDFAMIFIHGDPGENGKIQAYLDLFEIPYVNCNALTSSLTFDKWYCNNFLKSFEIPVAKNIAISSLENLDVNIVVSRLGMPLFVKPTDSGSSYGISKVHVEKDLIPAIKFALREGKLAIIESFLKGREITCTVFRNDNGINSLPLTEITTENDFFDFDAKYHGKSEEITPAQISRKEALEITKMAKKIYSILQLKSFVRIDFMLVEGIPYVIEVNTIPGFSNESIVPKMLEAAEIKTTDFLREIINFELKL